MSEIPGSEAFDDVAEDQHPGWDGDAKEGDHRRDGPAEVAPDFRAEFPKLGEDLPPELTHFRTKLPELGRHLPSLLPERRRRTPFSQSLRVIYQKSPNRSIKDCLTGGMILRDQRRWLVRLGPGDWDIQAPVGHFCPNSCERMKISKRKRKE